jgi:hypothetical protein
MPWLCILVFNVSIGVVIPETNIPIKNPGIIFIEKFFQLKKSFSRIFARYYPFATIFLYDSNIVQYSPE